MLYTKINEFAMARSVEAKKFHPNLEYLKYIAPFQNSYLDPKQNIYTNMGSCYVYSSKK